ncbi:uncharacterized protein BDV17DRAFT_292546 [Aspergillus undulatus]|uniref:uncharacterized protein n=1 Tax=Aspergillus undulatus TaxID=1810928 RepID=UPI003CCD89FB
MPAKSSFSCPDIGRSPGLHYQFGDQSQRLILPREILQMINEYIMGGRTDRPNYLSSVPAQLCRVISTWNCIFTPALYAHYRFHGSVNDLASLCGFLRTLVQHRHLATFVKELTLTTWGIHEEIQFDPRHVRQNLLLWWKCLDVFDQYWAIRWLEQTEHDSLVNRQAYQAFCEPCFEGDCSISEELKSAHAVAHYRLHWR